ncbi:hypothetical protein Sfr7A_31605 [Streptomyces xinghaiensis]|uniref:Uncharacterized protein n=1 Tax=Streptomyces xinghaiensis TaxID=1038928 RepID=A0A3R7H6R5_9ACTN|nr:hypothetical protein Sfr7A_31605 [Streptomyces xinghaiensis]RKM90944.1 hypothetical protein SFRA_030400 [Streptomyces xinghaiensis]RNC68945.1 hypothetical protein DC095_030645 [Streptomyces xinghaiensis]
MCVTILPPAPRPCAFCPYGTDVPSGVWGGVEYARLPLYDRPTYDQPARLFSCHVHALGDARARVCGGWAGCHDGDHLLALRLAVVAGQITVETAEAIRDYSCPVELFPSGAEAAVHGVREISCPGPEGRRAIDKIRRARADLT